MADYIDRDLTIQFLCEACSNFEGNICTLSEECEDIRIIRAMSAENVQPVRRGRWIDIYEYCKAHDLRPSGLEVCYWCSECDKAEKKTSDFCPNCGADMRNKED